MDYQRRNERGKLERIRRDPNRSQRIERRIRAYAAQLVSDAGYTPEMALRRAEDCYRNNQ